MTRSFLYYSVLRVASHPQYRGEDLPQLVHLPRGRHHLRSNSSRLQVQVFGVLPHCRIQVSLSVPPPPDGPWLLAVTDVLGSSTWRAGVTAIWIASVEDTASIYDFHGTYGKTRLCKNRLHIFT
jgi:hypothetical protein